MLTLHAGSLLAIGREERERIRNTAQEEGIELTFCIGLPPAYDVAGESAETRKTGFAGASVEYKLAATKRSILSMHETAKGITNADSPIYIGKLSLTHSAPYPVLSLG